MNNQTTFRMITAAMLCVCLLTLTFSFVSPTVSATTLATAFADDPDVAQGASQFDEAAREVQGILNLDLNTEKGVKEAAAILKRNQQKLAQVEKKALHAAMHVASFQKGLKDEAAKRKGGEEELAKALEANHDLVATIPGAQEAADAIKESTRPAAETLKRVSEALQKAGDKAKGSRPANHHASVKTAAEVEPQGFCGPYSFVCDLLTRVGLYVLRNELRVMQMTTRKVNCVLTAYDSYGSCAVMHWAELAICNSRLALAISNCIRYA
jgi:hypothetical protein